MWTFYSFITEINYPNLTLLLHSHFSYHGRLHSSMSVHIAHSCNQL